MGELIPGTRKHCVSDRAQQPEEGALGGTESPNLRVSAGFPLVRGEKGIYTAAEAERTTGPT